MSKRFIQSVLVVMLVAFAAVALACFGGQLPVKISKATGE